MSTEIIDGNDGTDFHDSSPKSNIASPSKNNYNKDKDLAEILIAGVKVKYGAEKSEQLNAEFERRRQQPAYRGNAEELTAIVDRVCGEDTEISRPAESIDAVVESYSGKLSMLRVAAKGTANLARKAHLHQWYYPFVGFLPAKYQGKIAEKYGDKPIYYTVSNAIAEGIAAAAIASYLNYQYLGIPGLAVAASLLALAGGVLNTGIRAVISDESKEVKAAGSLLTGLSIYYTAAYSVKAAKAIKNGVTEAFKESYKSALQQEQQKLLEANQGHSSGLTGNPIVNWDLVNRDKQRVIEAKHQQEYDNAGVRVVATQARIKQQPEIVLTPDGERFEESKPAIVEDESDEDLGEPELKKKNYISGTDF